MAIHARDELKLWHISRLIVFPALLFLMAFLLFLACHLKIDYFDSFSIFLNSKSVAGQSDFFYRDRPALLPVILSPFFWLEARLGMEGFAVIASRVSNVLFFALFLVYLYKLLRISLNSLAALWGILFAALNPLLIHYAPFVKEDIPGLALGTAALYHYWRQSGQGTLRHLIAAGVFTGLAVSMRQQLIAIFFLIFFADLVLTGWRERRLCLRAFVKPSRLTVQRMGLLFGVPLLLFLLIPAFVNAAAGRCRWWEGVGLFLADRLWQAERFSKIAVPIGVSLKQAGELLLACLPWPFWGLFVFGAWRSWNTNKKLFGLLSGFLCLIFVFQAVVLLHNEARYFFPAFPVLYFFGVSGLLCLAEHGAVWLKKVRLSISRDGCFIGLVLLCSVFPFKDAVGEILKFRDPVYSTPFQKEVCQRAARKAGSNRSVHWAGPMYDVYPKEYQFHPQDPYTYMYHLYNHACQFYTGKEMVVYNEPIVSVKDPSAGLFVPHVGNVVLDGDVLIVNADKAHDATTLEPKGSPLVIERIRRIFFKYHQTDEKTGEQIFSTESSPLAKITLRKSGDFFLFLGTGFRDGYYEFYAFPPNVITYTKSWGLTQVTDGSFKFAHGAVPGVTSIEEIILLYYTDVEEVRFSNIHSVSP